jgi:hypothetical protein
MTGIQQSGERVDISSQVLPDICKDAGHKFFFEEGPGTKEICQAVL